MGRPPGQTGGSLSSCALAVAVLVHIYLASSALALSLAAVWLFLTIADLLRTGLATARLRAGERVHVRV